MADKIILNERLVKTVTLPQSGATLEVYASLTVGDLQGFNPEDTGFDNAIKVLPRIIKSWNIFASESDEKPKEINETTISELPVQDLTHLMGEIEAFAAAQKKT